MQDKKQIETASRFDLKMNIERNAIMDVDKTAISLTVYFSELKEISKLILKTTDENEYVSLLETREYLIDVIKKIIGI